MNALQSLNDLPINQAALQKLVQTGEPPNDGLLYLLQLMTWAEEQEELHATSDAVGYRLNQLVGDLNRGDPLNSAQRTMKLMYPVDEDGEIQQEQHAQRLATMTPIAAGKFLLQHLAEQAEVLT